MPAEELLSRLPTLEHYAAFLQGYGRYAYPDGTWDFIATYYSLKELQKRKWRGSCNAWSECSARYAWGNGADPHLLVMRPNDESEQATTKQDHRGAEPWYAQINADPLYLPWYQNLRREEKNRNTQSGGNGGRAENVDALSDGDAEEPEPPEPEGPLWHVFTACRTGEREFVVFDTLSVRRCTDLMRYVRKEYPRHHLLSRGGFVPWSHKKNNSLAKFSRHIGENVSLDDMKIAPFPSVRQEKSHYVEA